MTKSLLLFSTLDEQEVQGKLFFCPFPTVSPACSNPESSALFSRDSSCFWVWNMYWAAANLIWITVLLQIVFASKKDLGSVEKFNICESLIDCLYFYQPLQRWIYSFNFKGECALSPLPHAYFKATNKLRQPVHLFPYLHRWNNFHIGF